MHRLVISVSKLLGSSIGITANIILLIFINLNGPNAVCQEAAAQSDEKLLEERMIEIKQGLKKYESLLGIKVDPESPGFGVTYGPGFKIIFDDSNTIFQPSENTHELIPECLQANLEASTCSKNNRGFAACSKRALEILEAREKFTQQCERTIDLRTVSAEILFDRIHYCGNEYYPVCAKEVIVPEGLVITTEGKSLNVEIIDRLSILGTATVRSYDLTSVTQQAQRKASPGPNGASYDPGPQGNGRAPDGENGMGGGHGLKGQDGLPGSDGNGFGCIQGDVKFQIRQKTKLSGRLVVDLKGNDGGQGENGGDGGSGGDGQQGGSGVVKFNWLRIGYCDKGGGYGGRGGNGGDAGLGGNGGSGQSGASFIIKAPPNFNGDISNFSIESIDLSPGKSGLPGAHGIPGPPGKGGFGGLAVGPCLISEVYRRKGKSGDVGNLPLISSNCGSSGKAGTFGNDIGIVPKRNLTQTSKICQPSLGKDCNKPRTVATPSPEESKSCAEKEVIHGLWQLLFHSYEKFFQQKENTDRRLFEYKEFPSGNCSRYLIVEMEEPEKLSPQWGIRNFLLHYAERQPSQPLVNCTQNGSNIDYGMCCIGDVENPNVSAECLSNLKLQDPADGLLFGMGIYPLIAAEIAKHTILFPLNGDASLLDEGETYFVWRGPTILGFPNKGFLMTKLSAQLVEELAAIIKLLSPSLQKLNPYLVDTDGVWCSNEGFKRVNIDKKEEGSALFISTGKNVSIRRPPQFQGQPFTKTLEVYPTLAGSTFLLSDYASCPVANACNDGSVNTCLMDYLDQSAKIKSNPFPCLKPKSGNLTISDLGQQLNDAEAAAVVFYSIYIAGTWFSNSQYLPVLTE